MKITKYKRGGDPRHVIEYKDAPGRVAVGKLGTDEDAPDGFDQIWRDLRSECESVYGQKGMNIREVRWTYDKDNREEEVQITGEVPHWSGEVKTQLPKFTIRVINAYDEVQETFFVKREYHAGLETVGETVDRLRDALVEFVRKGTSQMDLEFGNDVVEKAAGKLRETMRTVSKQSGVESVTISGAGKSLTFGRN